MKTEYQSYTEMKQLQGVHTFNRVGLAEVMPILQENQHLQTIVQAIQAYNGDTYEGLVNFLESTTGYRGIAG